MDGKTRVWEARNGDGTVIQHKSLRSLLKAARFYELATGHFVWAMRSYVGSWGMA